MPPDRSRSSPTGFPRFSPCLRWNAGDTSQEQKTLRIWRQEESPPWNSEHQCSGFRAQIGLSKSDWSEQNPNYALKADDELRPTARIHAVAAAQPPEEWNLFIRPSNLRRLVRVTSWMRIFIEKLKSARANQPQTAHQILTPRDLQRGLTFAVRASQHASFAKEIEALINERKDLPAGSRMINLKPVLDDDGCVRVGGRLHHASISYVERHPFILDKKSTLARLLVIDPHQRTMHGGTQSTLHYVSTSFWILGTRSFVRSLVHKCVICTRFRGQTVQQQMGQLPPPRVSPQRPFTRSGVEFDGPILVRMSGGRGIKAQKGYIFVFVCMATKAVHLEIADDLSAKAFITAFHRFTSRRGHCAEIFSDNGTNFKGASTELFNMFREASEFYKSCAALLVNDVTSCTFNPTSAPHMGGLWEAAVKSAKHHLRRVIEEAMLTFEELSTLLAQIEACLNSRPLSTISADPRDLAPLTPGHFLVGEPLIAIPEPPTPEKIFPSDRYAQVTRMRDDFWKRWHLEYLQQLRTLCKWTEEHSNLQIDDVVIIKDEVVPPTKWPLARVIEVYPDFQSKVRRVKLRTATDILKRPVHKLAPLPTKPD